MIILGIDPGTAIMGYGVLKIGRKRALSHIDHGCITTSKDLDAGERLRLIERDLRKIVRTHKPDAIAVEAVYFFRNLTTAMPVSEAKGVVLLVAAKHKLPVEEFSPPQVKLAVAGHGRAEKKDVQEHVQKTLGLKDIPRPDDAADALSVAITYSLIKRS